MLRTVEPEENMGLSLDAIDPRALSTELKCHNRNMTKAYYNKIWRLMVWTQIKRIG